MLQDYSFPDSTFSLIADIDCEGRALPTGEFEGTFDGQGHVISNLCVEADGDEPAGLFGTISGTVRDVLLVNPVVTGGDCVGALAGEIASDDARVSRCGVIGAAVTASGNYAGAFAGQIGGGAVVSECFAAGTVASADNSAGGFAGYVEEATISDCYAVANVSGKRYAGSFAGKVVGPDNATTTVLVDNHRNVAAELGTFITDRAGLEAIADNLAGTYLLAADIDLAGADWTPLGFDNESFTGTFYGNGHVISHLVVTNHPAVRGRGLFGVTEGATIESVIVRGTVAGAANFAGGLVGNCKKGTNVNCSVCYYAAGPRYFCGNNTNIVGGVLSAADVATLSKDRDGNPWPAVRKHIRGATPIATAEDLLAVTNDLSGTYVLVADIDLGDMTIEPIGIGTNANAFSGEFYGRGHKISGFTVDTTNRYAGFFGNIVGGRVSDLLLEGRVYSHDNDSANGVGGFAGEIQSKSLVDGCLFTGWVETEDTGKVGAFVGNTDGLVTNSYYDETRTEQLAQGAFASGVSAAHPGIEAAGDMSDTNCLPNLDFDTIWEIDEVAGMPTFRHGEQLVTFDPNGGTCNDPDRRYDIGTYYDFLPRPAWSGHAFLGWFDAADGGYPIPEDSRVTTDATRIFYAHWIDTRACGLPIRALDIGSRTLRYDMDSQANMDAMFPGAGAVFCTVVTSTNLADKAWLAIGGSTNWSANTAGEAGWIQVSGLDTTDPVRFWRIAATLYGLVEGDSVEFGSASPANPDDSSGMASEQ